MLTQWPLFKQGEEAQGLESSSQRDPRKRGWHWQMKDAPRSSQVPPLRQGWAPQTPGGCNSDWQCCTTWARRVRSATFVVAWWVRGKGVSSTLGSSMQPTIPCRGSWAPAHGLTSAPRYRCGVSRLRRSDEPGESPCSLNWPSTVTSALLPNRSRPTWCHCPSSTRTDDTVTRPSPLPKSHLYLTSPSSSCKDEKNINVRNIFRPDNIHH